jgi:adenylosuccinate synthase
MKKIDVVIGAGYGDEGKGLMTDYLTGQQEKPSDTVVVRFNGGAQAGHTVQNDKCRHVFKHYSSGTLHGATTCLSRFFVVNPLLWAEEYEALYRKSVWQRSLKGQRLLIDARAHVSTPYDMLYNQIIELSRGAARHGSCGVGFGVSWCD